jgi:CRP-like cAMP-binding protein
VIASERERFLRSVPLFGDLDPDELRALAEVSQFVRFPDAALIFREGEAGDCAYVVVQGSVEVFTTDRNGDEVVLAQLKELEHVGEQSLLSNESGRRNASLRVCADNTVLLRIPMAEFQAILSHRPTLGDLLSETGRQQQIANVLRTAKLSRMWALFMFVNGFISIAILTALARLFDTPFIFPTLGAVAFAVFFTPTTAPASPRNVTSGNALGIAVGYAALWVMGLEHAGPATDATLGWQRILAVSLALATTSALMILLNIPHPPAAGTAMFVALGVVTKPEYLFVLEAAVVLLIVQAIVINRLTGVRYPLWSRVPPPQIGKRAGRIAAHRVAGLSWRADSTRRQEP